jgi:NADH-quinone oxidoreductase subunit N
MLLTISANDFFVAFISLEVQSLGLFIFLSFRKNSSMAIEAAIKYFMFTAFSGGILVFGVSLLFSEFGTTNF